MKVLYFTHGEINDWDVIPDIIRAAGDEVTIHTHRVDLELVKEMGIEYIVSDRARYLIKQDVVEYLPRKIVNLHPSFLPWNRGYHPNYWAIKEGTPFGVTLHYIDKGIDTGDIIAQTRAFYSSDDTLRTTYDRLRNLMVALFQVSWPEVRESRNSFCPQEIDGGSLHYRRDFDFSTLPAGWDTEVGGIRKN